MTTRKNVFYGILAMVSLLGLGITQSAQATILPGAGDPFVLHFDENGNGIINPNGTGNLPDPGFAQVDPTTGHNALTYLLSENIQPGVVDVFDSSGALSDAMDFYNIGNNGFMAYYSGDMNGGTLADLLSAGFVPLGFHGPTEVGENFTWLPGGNEYFGVSSAPDGGSTLALLGVAMLVVGLLHRRIKAATNRA